MKRLAFLLGLLVLGSACRSRPAAGPPAETGELHLTLDVAAASLLAAGPAAWVHVHGTTVQGDPLDAWIRAAREGSGYTATVSRLPAGSYGVGARIFANGTADPLKDAADFLSTADVPVTVLARTSRTVALLLQQNPARLPPQLGNVAPAVHGLVGSALEVDTSDPAAALELVATASDPDPGDVLTYAWAGLDASTSAAVGTFSAPAAPSTRWTPPPLHQGAVAFTLTATDTRGARSSLSLRVKTTPRGGSGSLVTVVGVNHAPEITRVDAARGQLAPLEATTVTATASDPDGDVLSYAWSDGGCGGSFDVQGAASTTWHAPAALGSCALAVTVSDRDGTTGAARGASTTSTIVLHVVTTSGATAPEIVLATQAPARPVAPDPVWFRVLAVEPSADPAVTVPVTSILWADGTGRAAAFAPLVPGAWDAVEWTPPTCPGGGPLATPFTVTATARGAPLDPAAPPRETTFAFSFDLQCP
jgi:hypothetical protein